MLDSHIYPSAIAKIYMRSRGYLWPLVRAKGAELTCVLTSLPTKRPVAVHRTCNRPVSPDVGQKSPGVLPG